MVSRNAERRFLNRKSFCQYFCRKFLRIFSERHFRLVSPISKLLPLPPLLLRGPQGTAQPVAPRPEELPLQAAFSARLRPVHLHPQRSEQPLQPLQQDVRLRHDLPLSRRLVLDQQRWQQPPRTVVQFNTLRLSQKHLEKCHENHHRRTL